MSYRAKEDQTINNQKRHLEKNKELSNTARQGRSNYNLRNPHQGLGDVKKVIKYHEQHLSIAKEVGDRAGEGRTYGNLGNAFDGLGDFDGTSHKVQRATSQHC